MASVPMTAVCWVMVPRFAGVAKLLLMAPNTITADSRTTSGLSHGYRWSTVWSRCVGEVRPRNSSAASYPVVLLVVAWLTTPASRWSEDPPGAPARSDPRYTLGRGA